MTEISWASSVVQRHHLNVRDEKKIFFPRKLDISCDKLRLRYVVLATSLKVFIPSG